MKTRGEPFETEMAPATFQPVPMPAGIKDLRNAKVMLITDGGLVPKGNPDKIQGSAATRWGSYSIKDCDDLKSGKTMKISQAATIRSSSGQYPDRLVPLDVLREA